VPIGWASGSFVRTIGVIREGFFFLEQSCFACVIAGVTAGCSLGSHGVVRDCGFSDSFLVKNSCRLVSSSSLPSAHHVGCSGGLLPASAGSRKRTRNRGSSRNEKRRAGVAATMWISRLLKMQQRSARTPRLGCRWSSYVSGHSLRGAIANERWPSALNPTAHSSRGAAAALDRSYPEATTIVPAGYVCGAPYRGVHHRPSQVPPLL